MKTNLFKTFILLFGLSLFLWNCDNEGLPSETFEAQKTKGYSAKRVSLSKLKNNGITKTILNSIAKKLDVNRKNETINKDIQSNDSSFTILTDEIIEVIQGENIIYSFRIETPTYSVSNFENFVIKQEGEVYSFYIYRYLFEDGVYKTNIQEVDEDMVNLEDFELYVRTLVFENGCAFDVFEDYTYVICCGSYCEEMFNPDESIAGGVGDYPSDVNGGTGGPNNSNSNNSNPDSPVGVVLNEEEIALVEIFNCVDDYGGLSPIAGSYLSQQQSNESHNDSSLIFKVESFINTNGCSEETKNFIEFALLEEQEGAEIDWEDKIVLDSTFVNNSKVKCIYNKLKNISSSYFSNVLSDFDNNKVSLLKFKTGNIPNSTGNKAVTLPRYGGATYRTFDIVLDEQFIQNASNIEIALALIHETVHAEIMERCIQLGIISSFNNSVWTGSVSFSSGQIISTDLSSNLFAIMIDLYSSYGGPPINTNWQHDIFNVSGYRDRISTDLSQAHLWLDDNTNPFENNLNTGTILTLTMEEFFNYISWLGLEGTSAYGNLSNLDLTKIQQTFNQMEQFYNENCN